MSRSRTNNIFYGLRLLTTDADEGRRIVDAFRVYPYARREDPLPKRIVRPTGGRWLQAQPAGLAYFRVLAAILDREPVEERDLFFAGIARSLGMERGKPFAPDERTARILTAAATQGEAMAQVTAFAKRFSTAVYRPGSRWDVVPNLEPDQTGGGLGQFFERAAWFYEATGMSQGMVHPSVGAGHAYLGAYTDASGAWLDGGRAYRLRVPPGAPARQFWSVCIYDSLTRTLVDNTSRIAELSSRQQLNAQPDGTVEMRFGPERPPENEAINWLQTVGGRAWFAYLRLYGPTEAYFDHTWPLPDIDPI
ncbi:MAG: DUF1254 domain-containing protein [Chloroflexi bacterium]|nr:DUF1254 domain-containing protein [Chloroflexota bacterium]